MAQQFSYTKPLRHEKYMDEVAPNLWLGELKAALDKQKPTLTKHKITHVVSIGCFQEWWQLRKEPKHMLLPLEDTPFAFITDYFQSAFRFMEDALNAGNGVLVHCEQGRSRSGALVIAYLMKRNKKGYPETLNKVLVHRKRVMPNIGFQIQLRAFGKHRWSTTNKYSDVIGIERELANALKNLATQVSKLQSDIRENERIFVTIEKPPGKQQKKGKNGKLIHPSELEWKRMVHIGLNQTDLVGFRKEWVLLVFLCHQFQLYKIAVHKDIINILYILGEMYFIDLLTTFDDVFHPTNKSLIMDYDDPSASIAFAIDAHAKEAMELKLEQQRQKLDNNRSVSPDTDDA